MHASRRKTKIIILCGPTAVGKTSAAMSLARVFNIHIVNADSMQVYRYMDIGTAKPTPEEQRQVPHHLIDIVNPDESFDAAQYAKQARRIIEKLDKNHITPLVVGGTGLYIKALVHGLFEAAPSDVNIRRRLKQELDGFGAAAMYARLKAIDPQTASHLHPNDTHRILRAVEVYETSGKSISAHHEEHRFSDQPYRVLKIGLKMDRKRLYQRIDARVEEMIKGGLLDEVQKLLALGYDRGLKPMQSIGYRQVIDFLQGRMPWAEAMHSLKQDTRRYAKRQMTWFKKDPEILWKDSVDIEEMITAVRLFLLTE
jgi:tRNA dimethylallyltransferase